MGSYFDIVPYHYLYKKIQKQENLVPLLNWLLEQKCNINLPGNSTKKSLRELAEENKDTTIMEWAEKNGAVPAIKKDVRLTTGSMAVGGVIFTKYEGEMRVLLVEKSNYWCGPGGLVEPEENTFQALLREIKEETSLDLSESKFESTSCYRIQVGDRYLRELYYLKLHATDLPWVKAEDDVADARWVRIDDLDFKTSPVLYNRKPILTSNSLLIRAKTSGILEESSIETALYYESEYGKNEFERELSRGDLQMIDYFIPKGIMLAETNATTIATRLGNKMMLKKLLAVGGGNLNKIDSKHTILLEAYRFKRNFAFYLIEQHQAEWRTIEPSFIFSILMQLDFPFIKYLISRQEKLSRTFFDHCITQFIFFENPGLLKLLLSFYPKQAVQQFVQEDHLIAAAGVSFPIFELLFFNGKAEISKNLLNKLKQMKMLEDSRQTTYLNFPSLYADSSMCLLPPEKSPDIYLVMEFINKLLKEKEKEKEKETKSYETRFSLLTPSSNSTSTTTTQTSQFSK